MQNIIIESVDTMFSPIVNLNKEDYHNSEITAILVFDEGGHTPNGAKKDTTTIESSIESSLVFDHTGNNKVGLEDIRPNKMEIESMEIESIKRLQESGPPSSDHSGRSLDFHNVMSVIGSALGCQDGLDNGPAVSISADNLNTLQELRDLKLKELGI